MIYVVMPCGTNFGWGVCGKYTMRELAKLDQVRLVAPSIDPRAVGNDLEHRYLSTLLVTPDEFQRLQSPTPGLRVPVLQAIRGADMVPLPPRVNTGPRIGYTFFEALLNAEDVQRAAGYFDVIAGGCTWCTDILREKGFPRVATVIQGVDPLIFHPGFAVKEWFKDRFVIFSGGKLEFRKGQDLVIRAFKVLHDKYRDVMLVNSWFNHWPATAQMMAGSPHIRFRPMAGDYVTCMNQMLAENGIDLSRVVTLPAFGNEIMARVYQNTDVGLFPNRCEGGTNLVLMEYMACGKPVIASYSTGHRDVLTAQNALLLQNMRQLTVVQGNGQPYAKWDDPHIDEVIAQLEWAYLHREELPRYGRQAATDMANRTWAHTARDFHRLLTQG
jgi:glycosyltransferase involved in cell wall biosynthesis